MYELLQLIAAMSLKFASAFDYCLSVA